MGVSWTQGFNSAFINVSLTIYIYWQIWKKKLKIKRITQSSMKLKCQVALMKVVTYQFISKSPAEVN